MATGLGLSLTSSSPPAAGRRRATTSSIRTARRRTTRAGRSACSASWARVLRRADVRGLARHEPAGVPRHQQHPDAVPVHAALPDTANETYLTQNVTNPFAGHGAGEHDERRHGPAQQLLRPFPEFLTFGIEEYGGSDSYQAGTILLEKRFKKGSSLTFQYTHSSLRDKRKYLNPADNTLEDRCRPTTGPTACRSAASCSCPSATARSGAVTGTLRWTGSRRWQVSGTYQYQDGFPLTWGTGTGTRLRDPSSLQVEHRREGRRRHRRARRAGLGRLVLLLPRRGGQTNGVDDPVKQRADQRIQLATTSVLPVPRCPTSAPTTSTSSTSASRRVSSCRSTCGAGAVRGDQWLNYTVLWNPDVNPGTPRSASSTRIGKQPARRPDRVQATL